MTFPGSAMVIAGRGRHVRLVPIRALECAEVECIKLAESKGAISLTAGPLGHGAHGFAVLCKKQNAYVVNVYEITRTAARRVRVAELRACGAVLSLQLAGARLLLGYRGGIAAHALPDPRRPHHDQPAVCTYPATILYISLLGASPPTPCPTRAVPTTTSPPSVRTPPLYYTSRCWGHRRPRLARPAPSPPRPARRLYVPRHYTIHLVAGGIAAHALPDPRRPHHDQPAVCTYPATILYISLLGASPPTPCPTRAVPTTTSPPSVRTPPLYYTSRCWGHRRPRLARPAPSPPRPARRLYVPRHYTIHLVAGGIAAHALPDPRRPHHDQPAVCTYPATILYISLLGASPPTPCPTRAVPTTTSPPSVRTPPLYYTSRCWGHRRPRLARPAPSPPRPARRLYVPRHYTIHLVAGGIAAHALPDPRRPHHDQPAVCTYPATILYISLLGASPPTPCPTRAVPTTTSPPSVRTPPLYYTSRCWGHRRPRLARPAPSPPRPARRLYVPRHYTIHLVAGGIAAHALPDPRRPHHDQPAVCTYPATILYISLLGASPPTPCPTRAVPTTTSPPSVRTPPLYYTSRCWGHRRPRLARPAPSPPRPARRLYVPRHYTIHLVAGGIAAHALPDPRRPHHDQPAVCTYPATILYISLLGASPPTPCPTRAVPTTTSPPSVRTPPLYYTSRCWGHRRPRLARPAPSPPRPARRLYVPRHYTIHLVAGGIAAHALPDPRRPHHDQPAVCTYPSTILYISLPPLFGALLIPPLPATLLELEGALHYVCLDVVFTLKHTFIHNSNSDCSTLVHPENQVNVFLSHSGARPLGAAPLACGDTLLVFNSLALYVDRHGHRARDTELMYTAHPTHHAINDTHLLIFTATHIDVYDIETGDWVQTMNIRKFFKILLFSS
ncbi:unnamed protein product [Spodoptera exigua]|nr:unnamed protein product [Spodoptera exigua]